MLTNTEDREWWYGVLDITKLLLTLLDLVMTL